MAEPLNQGARAELRALPTMRSPAPHWPAEYWETWGAARHGARVVLTRFQAIGPAPLVRGATLTGIDPRYGLIFCIGTVTVLYSVTGVHKMWLLARGEAAAERAPSRVSPPAAQRQAAVLYGSRSPLSTRA